MTTIPINGVAVDADDPCALYQALYATKLRILAGEHVAEMSIQSPVTRESVVFSSVKWDALNDELNRLAAACAEKRGERRPRRRMSLRF